MEHIENLIKNLHLTLEEACDAVGITVAYYEEARKMLATLNLKTEQ